jgi:hypothetical protein
MPDEKIEYLELKNNLYKQVVQDLEYVINLQREIIDDLLKERKSK